MQQLQDDGLIPSMLGQEVLEQAISQLDAVLTSDAVHARAVYCTLASVFAARGDRIRVRLVCAESVLDNDYVGACIARGLRIEARVADAPASDVLLADARLALVRAGRPVRRESSIVRDPLCVQALGTLFNGMWRGAVTASERVDFGDGDRAELTVRILRGMHTGVTDEVAARELSVSVRTYRRHVAEIMTALRANSRFQAGAQAAYLGLLAPHRTARSA